MDEDEISFLFLVKIGWTGGHKLSLIEKPRVVERICSTSISDQVKSSIEIKLIRDTCFSVLS